MSKNIDRRKILTSLSGLASIPFLGNEANADYNEAEVKTLLNMLVEDIIYFNKLDNTDYSMGISTGTFKDSQDTCLWLNVVYDPEGLFGVSHGNFFLGPKSDNITIKELSERSIIILPNNSTAIKFNHKNKEFNGKYLLLGNPRVDSATF